jgi:4a-hydroxytetrahydrobiopterin dehydratase
MKKLTDAELEAGLKTLPGWSRDGNAISKTYSFKDYYQTMAFVNAAAWVAHGMDHHPDMLVSYSRCRVSYSTHDAGGVTARDFEAAQRVEAVFEQRVPNPDVA